MGMDKRDAVTEIIRQRVVSEMHLGLIARGSRLPSVRELSREVRANPRVVLAAYQRLEEEGLVEMRERSGIFLAPGRADFRPEAADLIVAVLTEAIRKGISPQSFSDVLRRGIAPMSRRAAVLECNGDQLFSVSEELRTDFGFQVHTIDLEAPDGEESRDIQLQRVDVFITTSLHAAEVRKLSDRYGIPSIVVTMCTELFAGVRQRLEHEQVYFVVTDPRFGRKLERIFAETKGAANLRVLVNGRDDLAGIPAGAATYVTRITRKTLGSIPLLDRLIPEAHVFSAESGREILSFLVRSNLLEHQAEDVVARSSSGVAALPVKSNRSRAVSA